MNSIGAFVALATGLVLASIGVLCWPVMAAARASGGARPWRFLAGVSLFVVAVPVAIHGLLGGWQLLPELAAGAAVPAPAATADGQGPTAEQIRAMVDRLAEKLKTRPDDIDGWMMLGRSSMMLERFEVAADAWARASALRPGDAQIVADQADALAMAQGQRLSGKPAELVAKALALDPKNLKALVMSAAAALERGDSQGAIGYWEQALKIVPAGSEAALALTDYIRQVREGRGTR
jgi:cytochrome c-type biogenesis protein CcmH